MATNTIPSPPIFGNPFRVTMFFKTPYHTFTETHWFTGTSPSYTSAKLAGINLMGLRTQLVGTNVVPFALRVSQDNVFRDGLLTYGPFASPPPTNGPADPTEVCVLMSCNSNFIYRKSIYLAAVPDLFTIGEQWLPSPNWDSAWKLYRDELTTNWGFLAQLKEAAKPDAAGSQELINSNVSQGGIGTDWAIVTKSLTNFAIGDQVRVRGVKGTIQLFGLPVPISSLNRRWIVATEPTASSFTLLDSNAINGTQYNITSYGFTHRLVRGVVPYTQATYNVPDGLRQRKRGARAFLPRGRSSIRQGINL